MQKITALKPQKRNKERVNVYLDDVFAFGLALDAAIGLHVGQTLSADEIAALKDEDAFVRAKGRALRYLGYRPRSVDEVRRNLARKGVEEPVIERVLAYLEHYDYVDDLAFAEYWIEQRETFKPRGRLALQQELRQKGVARRTIDEALADLDETQAARRAAMKRGRRYANLPYDEFRRKLGGFLQRRGFRYGTARDAVDRAWQEYSEEEDTAT
ncbi:MAG: RecX family transcriptional regulator [Candidatus Promineifilaceae bacterium]|nr:RecX family transcriptional regulator [Candidatus Promineifilaceae bacterium]